MKDKINQMPLILRELFTEYGTKIDKGFEPIFFNKRGKLYEYI